MRNVVIDGVTYVAIGSTEPHILQLETEIEKLKLDLAIERDSKKYLEDSLAEARDRVNDLESAIDDVNYIVRNALHG